MPPEHEECPDWAPTPQCTSPPAKLRTNCPQTCMLWPPCLCSQGFCTWILSPYPDYLTERPEQAEFLSPQQSVLLSLRICHEMMMALSDHAAHSPLPVFGGQLPTVGMRGHPKGKRWHPAVCASLPKRGNSVLLGLLWYQRVRARTLTSWTVQSSSRLLLGGGAFLLLSILAPVPLRRGIPPRLPSSLFFMPVSPPG